MCLAIPGKVMEINENNAVVDYGGVRRGVDISLVDAKLGDYVIVHAGFAIQLLDETEAKETLKIWQQLLDAGE